jgi:putative ABC transport system ATP-binding protein
MLNEPCRNHNYDERNLLKESHPAPIIALNNIYKNYTTPAGDFPALRGINLQVYPGEFVAIIGKSGAGKTTLVNMITGIDKPTKGEIWIMGAQIEKMTEEQKSRWRGENLGIVFQFFQLLPTLNLLENLTLPMDFRGDIKVRDHKARALEILGQVGIQEHAFKKPAKISGGQQQRVAIARALANDPPIFIADEPTGNLDSRTAKEIIDLFSGLVEAGKTLLIVSHDKEIARRAGRTIEIADGKIVGERVQSFA